jgi:hypothetical protein
VKPIRLALATMDGSEKKEGPNVQDPKMEDRNTMNGWTNFYLGSSRKSCNVKEYFHCRNYYVFMYYECPKVYSSKYSLFGTTVQ